jgi:hypothetical protein
VTTPEAPRKPLIRVLVRVGPAAAPAMSAEGLTVRIIKLRFRLDVLPCQVLSTCAGRPLCHDAMRVAAHEPSSEEPNPARPGQVPHMASQGVSVERTETIC